jgi:hypothetical protein
MLVKVGTTVDRSTRARTDASFDLPCGAPSRPEQSHRFRCDCVAMPALLALIADRHTAHH